MWQETFDEKHKQGLERLTGGNKYRLYINESENDGQYTYDVYEFQTKPTDAQIKSVIISDNYSLEEEVKILRKTIAALLNANSVEVEEFSAYNDKVESITYAVDELGKVVQTAQGSGTAFDPYKVWKVGMSVVEGDWWMTQDGYIWQAKMSGVPASSTDSEYWDIPEGAL